MNFSDGPGGDPFDDAAGFWETGQHRMQPNPLNHRPVPVRTDGNDLAVELFGRRLDGPKIR